MTYLPYAVRHLHRTIEDHVFDRLTTLGWLGPAASVPFGAAIVEFQRGAMDESELKALTGNVVTVSFGGEPDDQPQEMGGGLLQVHYPVFVDCLGEKESLALAIASSVKDLFAGRAPGTSRYVTLYDYTGTPRTPVVGHALELADVAREEGAASVRRNWQIVKATIEHTYIGEDDGS